jgi:hypothetical protein
LSSPDFHDFAQSHADYASQACERKKKHERASIKPQERMMIIPAEVGSVQEWSSLRVDDFLAIICRDFPHSQWINCSLWRVEEVGVESGLLKGKSLKVATGAYTVPFE